MMMNDCGSDRQEELVGYSVLAAEHEGFCHTRPTHYLVSVDIVENVEY